MRRLFLASEAKHPESVEKLKNFVGNIKEKRIVYIPTAANGDRPKYNWMEGGSAKMVKTLGSKVEFLELEKNEDPTIHKVLQTADIIWLAVGMGGYLMYWLNRTGLNKKIPELVNKGITYVGSSAGSWVAQKKLGVAEWFIGDSEPGANLFNGMGMVDFEIYPHYEDNLLPEIQKQWKGGDLYLLKNGEVITIEDDKMEILGEKRILRNGQLIT